MQFPVATLAFASLLMSIVSGAAVPVEKRELNATAIAEFEAAVARIDGSLKKRANEGIYLCTDSAFSGTCVHLENPEGDCINLDGTFNDQVSSAGPDSGDSGCNLYQNFGCSGDSIYLQYPGSSDLRNQNFNDEMSSYICYS